MRSLLVLSLAVLLITGCSREETQEATEIEAPSAAAPSTAAGVGEALQDKDPRRRFEAARSLPGREDIPASRRAGLLFEALEQEVSEPTPGPPIYRKSYLPASDFLKLHYTRSLGELGPDAVDTLKKTAEEGSGEVRERAVLALGYAGEREVIPRLRELLRLSEHWQVRNSAAYLLGELQAEEAVPELKQALQDNYTLTREVYGDLREFYPVRQKAAGALKKLGFGIERGEGADEFRVLEP